MKPSTSSSLRIGGTVVVITAWLLESSMLAFEAWFLTIDPERGWTWVFRQPFYMVPYAVHTVVTVAWAGDMVRLHKRGLATWSAYTSAGRFENFVVCGQGFRGSHKTP